MAFPNTPILDTFNRANGSAGANWTTPILAEFLILKVNTNLGSFEDTDNGGYWNPSTFGPDCEVYATASTTNGTPLFLFLRVNPTGASANGYRLDMNIFTSRIERVDAGVGTTLGAAIGSALSGEKWGLEAVGSTFTAYRDQGSGWASVAARTDATYAGSGSRIGTWGQSGAQRIDDFGGGTPCLVAWMVG